MMLILLAMVVFLLTNRALAEDWYIITTDGKCTSASEVDLFALGDHFKNPADTVRWLRDWEISHHVEDRKLGGRVVEVKISVYENFLVPPCSFSFYRLEQCKAKTIERGKKAEEDAKRLKSYE